MPHRTRSDYQWILWAFVAVGILVNGWVNYHQEAMNRASVQDRERLSEAVKFLNRKIMALEAERPHNSRDR